jgi:hypothetical protein
MDRIAAHGQMEEAVSVSVADAISLSPETYTDTRWEVFCDSRSPNWLIGWFEPGAKVSVD